MCNNLEGVVFQKYPILNDLKMLFYRKEAFFACMSGSGSTIYCLFSYYEVKAVVKSSIPKPYQIILAKPMITKNRL